jgi:heme/copper-type cytochrome/quinol oxidase subunit 2
MSAAVAFVLAVTDAAEEGKKVITAMLVVGLIFVGVIVLGEWVEWTARRRHRYR